MFEEPSAAESLVQKPVADQTKDMMRDTLIASVCPDQHQPECILMYYNHSGTHAV